MLKKSASVKIMLAHCTDEFVNRPAGHGVILAEFAKLHMQGLFVAQGVRVIEIGVFIVPHAQLESLPTLLFVYDQLTALEGRFLAKIHPTNVPNRVGKAQPAKIGPKD